MCSSYFERLKFSLILVLTSQMALAQSVGYNDGVVLTVESSVSIYFDDMGYTNQTVSSISGEIDNEGDIYIERDWTNNASSGEIFKNLNSNGNVHFSGSIEQQIGGTRTTTFEDLTINNSSAGVTLRNFITINESLTLTDGVLYTTSTDIIKLIDDATSSVGSNDSFVEGPFEKQGNDAFIFPLGDNTTWARFGITAPATNSTFVAQYFDAAYSDTENVGVMNNVSLVEYWNLTRSSGSASIIPTLYWENGTRSGIDLLSDLTVARYNGSNWVDETQSGGTTGTTSTGTVTGKSISNFGPISFGSGVGSNNPLPVELISFEAELIDDEVLLSWLTASEIDNDYFTVQKSRDGYLWQHVSDIPGAGNSNNILSYENIDEQPYSGQSYYRLKQTDFNGESSYSEIRPIFYQPADNPFFDLFPNPSNQHQVNVQIHGIDQGSKAVISIMDAQGRLVFNELYSLSSNILKLDMAGFFKKGMYYVVIGTGDLKMTKKLIIN